MESKILVGPIRDNRQQVKIIPKVLPRTPLPRTPLPRVEDKTAENKVPEGETKMLELVLDSRESCAPKIVAFFETNKLNLKVLNETMDIGDFLFRYRIQRAGVEDKLENLILIERKTISDMLSSIKADGRYKEQKTRLKALQGLEPSLRIYYLIEGIFSVQKTDRFFTEIDRKIMAGAYIGTIVRDGIPVMVTKDLPDTINTLQKIVNLIFEYPESFKSSNNEGEYTVPVKIKKSENRDARWCYLAQLQQIQGVSDQVALAIAEVYPNLQSLIDAYVAASKEGKDLATLLENLVLPDRKLTKTGKSRSIGPALSETIWISLGSPGRS